MVSAAGAGGMGEVYRARDTRLGRDVAVKILPETFASDAVRLLRFEQEVKVLSTLNHPNILAVYDVGESGGLHYFVTELLEGKDLRERIGGGALPLRKAVDYAIQVAHGLAAAHEKGIVHRDLKPENIFITSDGRAKLLDFGLAKPVAAAAATSATMTVASEAGTVLGTVGYMSPEQVRGKAADQRSDLFSFGVVLYEMLAGRKAFVGDSSVEVMNAILKEDPPEIATLGREVPPALDRILRRCLEKNPQERFQSARDLAFALEAISAPSAGSGTAKVLAEPAKRNVWAMVAGVALLSLIGMIAYVATRKAPSAPAYKQLTEESGYAGPARFSRDGNTVIYSAAWNGEKEQLYSRRANAGAAQSLGIDAEVMGISDDGDMAVILNRRYLASWLQKGTLARFPMDGGTPRPILEDVYAADISRDGKEFAVVRASGGRQQLEYPIGKVLYRTEGWISDVRISPDGSTIAFLDHPLAPDDRGGVATVDLNGKYKRLTGDYASSHGLAWSPDGKEIWHTGSVRGEELGLMAVSLDGKVREVLRVPIEIQIQDISRDGKVLLESIRFTVEMGIKKTSEKNSRMLQAGIIDVGAISHDGDWLVYNLFQGSDYNVFLRKTDGSPAVLLGEGYGAGITYDSKFVAAFKLADPHTITLYPSGPGEKREIRVGDLDATVSGLENGITFSRDGRKALFTALNPQKEFHSYLLDLTNGQYKAVTPAGTKAGRISPDAARVVAMDSATGRYFVVEIASGQKIEPKGVGPTDEVMGWTDDSKSLIAWNDEFPAKVFTVDPMTGQKRFVQEVAPVASLGSMYARLVTCADGSVAAYRLRRGMYTVYLAEGLK